MSHLLSRRDLDFLLYDWLDSDALTKRERYAEHSRETFDAVLDLCAEIADELFAPHNKLNDAHEPEFVDGRVRMRPEVKVALDAVAESGLLAAAMDEGVGGPQLPQSVQTACFAWFQAANPGTWAYAFLTVANANLLLAHGTDEQVDTYVRPMLEGRFHGTMCLSEPQAGSSLADITTRADPQPDGTYRVFGTKMWISAGDHELGENIVHLVLAKIPGGPAGVRGISLFLVPKYLVDPDGRRRAQRRRARGPQPQDGLPRHRQHAAELRRGRHTPGGERGAVGYLVGEPHQGLADMFHMMNEARVGVGAGATALGYTGYLKCLDYARTRTQGRAPGGKDPTAPPVPLVEHADVRRMLLAQKSYVEGALGLILYCGRLLDEERTAESEEGVRGQRCCSTCSPRSPRAGPRSGACTPTTSPSRSSAATATPASTTSSSTTATTGSTRSTRARTASRRSTCSAARSPCRAVRRSPRSTESCGPPSPGLGRRRRSRGTGRRPGAALDRLVQVTDTIHAADPDAAARLANASLYLEAAGHVVVAWVWLEQFLATGDRDDDFHQGKRQAARYFFRYELPRTGPQLDLLERIDRTTVDTDPQWL